MPFLAKNYEQFEGLMKRKNITIERGRGIAFLDDKKMKVKGSELGYFLSTIERIWQGNRSFLFNIAINQNRIIKKVKYKEATLLSSS